MNVNELFFTRFHKPRVDAIGSRWMSDNLVETIIANLWQQHPRPQCHVVIMGDNNLRHLEDDWQNVLRMMVNLVYRARDVPNSHVIVSTLMPSLENHKRCNPIFLEFDERLRHETILTPKHEVLDLGKSLRTKKGLIKDRFFENVHLNEMGAKLVAHQIFNKVTRTTISKK